MTALDVATAEISTLRKALQTRTTIGEAIGMLMQERGISSEHAWAYLVRISSDSEVKVRDIAAQMVEEANARAGPEVGLGAYQPKR
jgi:AmiR/NasT family two-component response regulator